MATALAARRRRAVALLAAAASMRRRDGQPVRENSVRRREATECHELATTLGERSDENRSRHRGRHHRRIGRRRSRDGSTVWRPRRESRSCWLAGRKAWKAQSATSNHAAAGRWPCPTDVSHFDQVQAAAEAAEREFGPIDLWINNAMVSMYSPFMEMTPEEFKHIVEVTFLGNVYGTQCALEADDAARSRRDHSSRFGVGLPFDSASERLLREQACDSGLYRIDPQRIDPPEEQRARVGREHAGAEHDAVHLDEEQNAAQGPADRHDLSAGSGRRRDSVSPPSTIAAKSWSAIRRSKRRSAKR